MDLGSWMDFQHTMMHTSKKTQVMFESKKKRLVKNVSVQHWFRKTWQGRSRPPTQFFQVEFQFQNPLMFRGRVFNIAFVISL